MDVWFGLNWLGRLEVPTLGIGRFKCFDPLKDCSERISLKVSEALGFIVF